jgi:hypothetical protein
MTTGKEDAKRAAEAALNSWDGAARAQAPAQLYAKTMALMERRRNAGWSGMPAFFARPAVALAAILLVLLLNAWLVYAFAGRSERTDTVTTLVNEYALETDLSYVDNDNR